MLSKTTLVGIVAEKLAGIDRGSGLDPMRTDLCNDDAGFEEQGCVFR